MSLRESESARVPRDVLLVGSRSTSKRRYKVSAHKATPALALQPGGESRIIKTPLLEALPNVQTKVNLHVCRKRAIHQNEGMSSFIRTPALACARDVHNPSPRALVIPHVCQPQQ